MDRLTESSTGFRECGVIYVGESDEDERRFSEWLEMARPYDIGARLAGAAQVAALMPGARTAYRCALHVPTDGCAEPQKAAPGAVPGLTVATGFSGHGFGIGPAAGRLAADLATGRAPAVELSAFRTSRFGDGSPIVIDKEI